MLPMDKPNRAAEVQPSLISFVLFLILAALTGALVGGGLAVAMGYAMGMDISTMASPSENTLPVRTFLRLSNMVSHLFTFTVPTLVLSYILYRGKWWAQLQLNRAPEVLFTSVGIVWILVSFPFAQLLYWLNRQLPLPQAFLDMEDSATRLLETVMTMNSPGELLLNILVVGVLPAIGEELLFRGLLQRRLALRFSPIWAIWITAIVFSAIHFQFAGFLPRMLLGALLGYLFYWSRNLWIPILAHFFFNSFQVIAQYAYGDQLEQLDMEGPTEPSWIGGFSSLLLLLILGYWLFLRRRKKVSSFESECCSESF